MRPATACSSGIWYSSLNFRRKRKLALTHIAIERVFEAGARKIIWQMFADNIPFQKFLNHLGASVEGRLREGTRRNGKLCDIVLMASFRRNIQ
jgi:RimJ/RimL family protein N-acetyltransferase